MKKVSRVGALTAGLCALLALTVGIASGAKVTTKTATATLPPDDTSYPATATCPKGAKATGGGGQLSNPDADYFQGSYPAGKRKWTATGERENVTGDEALTVFARCLKGAKLSTKSATTTLPDDDGDAHSITAKCPRGTKVGGGGMQLSNDDSDVAQPDGSFPTGKREWTAVGEAYDPGVELTVTARCLKGAKLTRRTASFDMPDDANPHAVTAKCPKGTKSVGGGVELSDPYDNYVSGSYPTGKREWTAVGWDDGLVTAHVVCLMKKKKK